MMARYILISFCCQLFLLAAGAAAEKSPLEVIQGSNEEILDIFRRADPLSDEDVGEIYRIMERITDFRKMSNRATAAVCAEQERPECRELRGTFVELLQHTALSKAGRYRADRFEYLGSVSRDNGQTLVKTSAYFGKESVRFDYVLEHENSETGWLVTNYIVDGVDTVQNYRQQFKRIVAKKSLGDLIARLRMKNEHYRNAGEASR